MQRIGKQCLSGLCFICIVTTDVLLSLADEVVASCILTRHLHKITVTTNSSSHTHQQTLLLPMQMDKHRPGLSMKPFDIPVLPLMTQHGPAGAFSHSPSSVAGISSGLGGMSINSSTQPNQTSQGQYGQPNQASQGHYGQPLQSSGANPQASQGVAGYSPLSDGQHGQLPQSGQSQYGQSGQGQYGQPNQPGQGQYGQPNQPGQGRYGQIGQGQYSQPGQGQYGQSHQAGQGQYRQAGQTSGGFDTYPDMSSNNQPFDGNKPYSSNPNGIGAEQYNQSQGGQQQQGQNGSYAAYPDLGHGNTNGYNQAGEQSEVC